MADEPKTGPTGIDTDVSMIASEAEALRELTSDPAQAEDGWKIYDFSIRWGMLISGRLKRLEYYYRAGELTGDQERRYRGLRRQLQDIMPQIERLGLGRPTVPFED